MMTETIRPAWLDVDADLKKPGPYSIFFVNTSENDRPAHSTAFPHYVFWNGFPIHYSATDYNGARNLIFDWEKTL